MKHKTWSRALSLAMSVIMLVSLLCVPAMAADAESITNVTTSGLDLTTLPTEETTYQAGEGTIVFTPASGEQSAKLTLNNATIDVEESTYGKAGITLPNGDFEIVVPENTTSTISSTKKISDDSRAITSPGGALTISGGGTLNLNAYDCDIYVYHDDGFLTIRNCTVNLRSASECGAYVEHDICLDNAKVDYACNAEIDPDDGPYANGLNSTDGTVYIVSDSTYTFGNSFYGVSAENCGAVIIRGSTVKGENCRSGFSVYPAENDDETLKNLIEDSNVHIESAEATFIDEGATEIKDSRVFLKSTNNIAVDHWYDGISISGDSYVELEGNENAVIWSKIKDKTDDELLALGEGLTIAEGELQERVSMRGNQQKLPSTQRLVITAAAVVTFDTQGGSEVAAYNTYRGGKVEEPDAPTRDGYTFAGWYSDETFKTAWNFGTDTVTENMTLYAKWIPAATSTYAVSGTVSGNEGEDMSGAVVKLMQGPTTVAAVTTGADGAFHFENLPAGTYTLVAEKGSRGVTSAVTVTADVNDIVMQLPTGDIITELVVDENTPNTYVSGLDALAEDSKYSPDGSDVVRIVLSVAAKEESEISEDAAKIKALAGKETLSYLTMDLEHYINGEQQQNITDTDPQLLAITVDYDTAKKNISVYRVHNDEAVKLTSAGDEPADGTYRVNDGSITIYATKFSTYAIGYTKKSSGGHTEGGHTSSSTIVRPSKNTGWKLSYRDCPRDRTCPIWPFTDASTTEWYHDGVHFCLENGLMVGYGSNTFQPDAGTTRGMIAVMLWRLNGSPVVNYAMSFDDVKAGAWYTEAIRWAVSEGIAFGYGNGKFGPDDVVTREQMVAILYRYAQRKGYDVSVGENTNILSYDDAFSVAQYAIPAMQWACGSGMVTGQKHAGSMILDPQGTTTRAQMSTMMMRFCAEIAK